MNEEQQKREYIEKMLNNSDGTRRFAHAAYQALRVDGDESKVVMRLRTWVPVDRLPEVVLCIAEEAALVNDTARLNMIKAKFPEDYAKAVDARQAIVEKTHKLK